MNKELTERYQGIDRSSEWWNLKLILRNFKIIKVEYKEKEEK